MPRLITLTLALLLAAPAAADPVKPDTPEQATAQVEQADQETERQIPPPPITEGYLELDVDQDLCSMWLKKRRDVRTCKVIVALRVQEQRETWAFNIPEPWDSDVERLTEQLALQQRRIQELERDSYEYYHRIEKLEEHIRDLERELAQD